MQVSRLFEIVYLLMDRKTMVARELAEHFEVSARTIYRDVDTLAQAGIPIYASQGKGGGISIMENFVLNKSVLSEEEQKSILSSLHGMNALKISEVRPVLEKLSALFGSEQEDWIEINFSSWYGKNLIAQKFEELKTAIHDHRTVEFTYSGMNRSTQLRRAEPVKLVFRGYDWYLLAWCQLREDFRYFKLLRMDQLAMLEERFVRKPYQEKPEEEKEIFTAPLVELTMRIAEERAYRVKDEFPPEKREQQPDGRFLVHLALPEDEWMYEYLMAYGDGLKVLAPQRVCDGLKVRLKKALDQYEI